MTPDKLQSKVAALEGDDARSLLKRIAATDPEAVAYQLDLLREEEGTQLKEVAKPEAANRDEVGLELAHAAPSIERSPQEKWLGEFKTRFDALPQLHQGVQWTDVEKTLEADQEAMRKLQLLDEAGFKMNVFGEKNGEIQFRTAQTDVTKITSKYRTIMADKKAQTDYPQYNVNGNAEEIAAAMGVEVADQELYEQFRVQNGWVWLKTDATTRKTGDAFYGAYNGIIKRYARNPYDDGSFCAALRVKKA